MTKIAIVGATGPTGIHLATELRPTAATVRVVARGVDKLARLFPDAAVEKSPADLLDADATLRAIEGCALVYDCLPRMKLTPEEALEVIEEAFQSLARDGRIYDTGERVWSERTKLYEIVWAAVPGAIDEAKPDPPP